MDDLPYGRREPRFKPQPSSWITRNGAFESTIVESMPQNTQTIQTRDVMLGNYRHASLKTPTVRIVDSRTDQFARNKQNIFFDSTFPSNPPTRLPRTAPGATRHGMTPYSYNTTWISHADPNTSLAPEKQELYQTSFLQTPVANQDRINRTRHFETVMDVKRQRQEHFEKYVESCENENKQRRECTQERIRHNRNDYLAALELRRKKERIKFYE